MQACTHATYAHEHVHAHVLARIPAHICMRTYTCTRQQPSDSLTVTVPSTPKPSAEPQHSELDSLRCLDQPQLRRRAPPNQPAAALPAASPATVPRSRMDTAPRSRMDPLGGLMAGGLIVAAGSVARIVGATGRSAQQLLSRRAVPRAFQGRRSQSATPPEALVVCRRPLDTLVPMLGQSSGHGSCLPKAVARRLLLQAVKHRLLSAGC